MIHLVMLFLFFLRETFFVTSLLISCTPNCFEKCVYSIRKEFVYIVYPYKQGRQNISDWVRSVASVSMHRWHLNISNYNGKAVGVQIIVLPGHLLCLWQDFSDFYSGTGRNATNLQVKFFTQNPTSKFIAFPPDPELSNIQKYCGLGC